MKYTKTLKIESEPAINTLITIKISRNPPAIRDSSAMPKANPPAENVPKALLNPLLSVAPTHLSYNNLKLAITLFFHQSKKHKRNCKIDT